MIHYTPLALEEVFAGYDQMKFNYREIQIDQMTMVVDQISPDEGKIVRLISPNPQDYLNPRYQPGNMIQYNFIGL